MSLSELLESFIASLESLFSSLFGELEGFWDQITDFFSGLFG